MPCQIIGVLVGVWKSGFDYRDIVKCDGEFFFEIQFSKSNRRVEDFNPK
jgi:hypothetical protein